MIAVNEARMKPFPEPRPSRSFLSAMAAIAAAMLTSGCLAAAAVGAAGAVAGTAAGVTIRATGEILEGAVKVVVPGGEDDQEEDDQHQDES